MKKIAFMLISLYMGLMGANAQTSNGYDVNGDGSVTITDVTMMVNHILGNQNENFIVANADINHDGSINVTDLTALVKHILIPGLVDDTHYIFLYVGQVKTVDISFGLSNEIGSGNYSVQNNVPSVAGVRIENGILIVTGISEGLDRFWVTDNNIKDEKGNPITQMYEVRVKQICPDSNHPHMIDLGLGTKWACCNVGASRPQEYGGYYAWGETEEKSVYNDITYQYSWGEDKNGDGYYDDKHYLGDDEWVYGLWQNLGDISGTGYDVAHMKWGGNWCMPSKDEIQGLIDNCTYEWTTLNGVNGGLFTGLSGNSIFIPDAGICRNADPYNAYYIGYTVWSSTPDSDYPRHAYLLWEDFEGNPVCDTNYRGWGISVRPVWKK